MSPQAPCPQQGAIGRWVRPSPFCPDCDVLTEWRYGFYRCPQCATYWELDRRLQPPPVRLELIVR